MFLKIPGLEGESNDQEHAGEIEVLSFSLSVSRPATDLSGGGATAPTFSDLSLTKYLDKASPKLHLHTAQGKHFAEAVLVVRKEGVDFVDYYKIRLQDVVITGVNTHGSVEENNRPKENVNLHFATVEWEYTPQKADGSLGTPIQEGWDLRGNKSL